MSRILVKVPTDNGRAKSEIKIPKNPEARKEFHRTYGRLLAEHKIWEVKSAAYGLIQTIDRRSSLWQLPSKEGYTEKDRSKIYEKGLSLYEGNELIRPIINLLASAISHPDIQGKRKDLTELADKIIDNNGLNFHDLAREGEIAGDIFLWFKANGDLTEIRSLDASSTYSILKDDNIRQIQGYIVRRGLQNVKTISPESIDPKELISVSDLEHLRFNSTTTSQYGRSSLRHVLYWIDVLDSLFEKNWLRGSQYYGNPLLAVIGVPGPYQATVKTQIEGDLQRAGKSWVLPPDTDVKVPDFSLNFPIGEIVGWVFRMISIATEIPVTLLGSADVASRGSAFFANPRFNLAMKPRREVWRIGLRNLFIKIFRAIGVIKPNEVLSRKDFDFVFLPIFDQDMEALADLVDVYRFHGLISKKTAREFMGLDHSDEEEEVNAEEEEKAKIQAKLGIPDPNDPNAMRARLSQNLKGKTAERRKKLQDLDDQDDDDRKTQNH